MLLFNEKERHDNSPAKHIDNSFDYYNRSAKPKASIIRNLLNLWFDNFPEDEKAELVSRFKSQFLPSFYELLIHELFLQQGYEISVHPKLTNSNKTPDYLVAGYEKEFYVEATIATDKSNQQRIQENRKNSFYDSLNRIESNDFFIMIKEMEFKTDIQPRIKWVLNSIEKDLKSLNPDALEITQPVEPLVHPTFTYENHEIRLKIGVLTKSKKNRGRVTGRLIGTYPITTFLGGPVDSIKSSANKKIKKYNRLDKPFVLCINSISDKGTDEIDVIQAVYGNELKSIDTENYHLQGEIKGMFSRAPYLSAILISSIVPGTILKGKYWFFENPNAKHKFDFKNTILSHFKTKGNQLSYVNRKPLRDIIRSIESHLSY